MSWKLKVVYTAIVVVILGITCAYQAPGWINFLAVWLTPGALAALSLYWRNRQQKSF
jgi:hypothetical protein